MVSLEPSPRRGALARAAARARLVSALLLLGALLAFASQNADVAPVRFLGWETEVSLALLLFLAFASGAAAGSLLTGWRSWRGRS